MPESPIRKLAKYADAAKLAGVHVYHLNIGQPDIKTPPQAMEAVRHFDQDILAYSPSQGLKSLRTKMVSYYADYGIDLSPDEIIITAGGSEAIMFAYMSCLNPGEEIIIGKDAKVSNVVIDPAYKEISRKHVSVVYDAERDVYRVTDYSSNGTWADEQRLIRNETINLRRGTVLKLANDKNVFRLG